MVLLLLFVFILGAVTVVAVEVAALWILITRFIQKVEKREIAAKVATPVADLNPNLYDKQGDVWILLPDKVPGSGLEDKQPTEQKKRKDIVEVVPVRKYARVKDHYLTLTETDGSRTDIFLRDCTIFAVSATGLSSRKWAKRYPIKVESKGSAIYKGHKKFYIYLETSWEKESWCKALRFASCYDEEKKLWYSKLSSEFHNYLVSLNSGYPSFMKPSGVSGSELMDKSVKVDNSSSKVRQFLKKLTKKSSKSGHDYKANGIPVSGYEDRKLSEKSRSFQESVLTNTLAKMVPPVKPPNSSFDDLSVASSILSSNEPGSESHLSGTSDADSDYRNIDEGALCLNLFISRLFFDAKNNQQIRSSIHDRIQRALSNMRIPSYIGEVTCTAVDLGTLPPRILAMRALPSDMNEVWAMEIDVEYLGGTFFDIETRLEIRELELQGEETRFQTNSVGEVTSDLLEGFDESLGKHLKLSEETIYEIKQKQGDHSSDETGNSKSTAGASSQVSKWKSLLHSITKQVSQVPLALGIKISSIRGTLRLCMKPPPSDQIWFGFTCMPDIDFNLESYVADHKITNGHLALFLVNRFKAGIRETLVLPNRESIGIPWMIAEKDDWVPRKMAPFMWYKSSQDSSNNSVKRAIPCSQPSETAHADETSHGTSEANLDKSKNMGSIAEMKRESSGSFASSSFASSSRSIDDGFLQELKAPLLEKNKLQEFGSRTQEDRPDMQLHSRSLAFTDQNTEEEESRLRRLGTRDRMRGLGKKMGEKLEVKRRHIEEKGRSFVERMRRE